MLAGSKTRLVRIGPSKKVVFVDAVKLACSQVSGAALKPTFSRKSVGVRVEATSAMDGLACRSRNASICAPGR